MRRRGRQALRAFCAVLLLAGGCAAHAELVAVVGTDSPASKISSEQLRAIFLMRLKTLPGAGSAQLVVVVADEAEVFTALGKSEDQIKAIWVRQVFTGGGSQPTEVPDVEAARKALKNPNGIAIIESSQVDASVRVIGQL